MKNGVKQFLGQEVKIHLTDSSVLQGTYSYGEQQHTADPVLNFVDSVTQKEHIIFVKKIMHIEAV